MDLEGSPRRRSCAFAVGGETCWHDVLGFGHLEPNIPIEGVAGNWAVKPEARLGEAGPQYWVSIQEPGWSWSPSAWARGHDPPWDSRTNPTPYNLPRELQPPDTSPWPNSRNVLSWAQIVWLPHISESRFLSDVTCHPLKPVPLFLRSQHLDGSQGRRNEKPQAAPASPLNGRCLDLSGLFQGGTPHGIITGDGVSPRSLGHPSHSPGKTQLALRCAIESGCTR